MTRDRKDYFKETIEVHCPDVPRPYLTKTPERTAMSLSLLASVDPTLVKVVGTNELAFLNANYMVVGWDGLTGCLLLERTWVDTCPSSSGEGEK